LGVVFLIVDLAAGFVLVMLDFCTLTRSHIAICFRDPFLRLDLRLFGFQPYSLTPIQFAGIHSMLDARLLVDLPLGGYRRPGLRKRRTGHAYDECSENGHCENLSHYGLQNWVSELSLSPAADSGNEAEFNFLSRIVQTRQSPWHGTPVNYWCKLGRNDSSSMLKDCAVSLEVQ
jgi:hypothetical protein